MLSIIKKAGIIGIWLVIWQIASSVTGLAFLLPGPVTVFLALGKALCTRAFYRVVFHSFIKISAGFLAALLAGLVLGSIAAVKKGVQSFLEPLVLLMRCLLLLQSGESLWRSTSGDLQDQRRFGSQHSENDC